MTKAVVEVEELRKEKTKLEGDRAVLNEIRTVDQELGFAMCRRLAKEEGIFCGGSTGLNVAGAIEIAKEMESGQRVVTLACDSGLKYLGGNIYT